jgi:hypothetical protein
MEFTIYTNTYMPRTYTQRLPGLVACAKFIDSVEVPWIFRSGLTAYTHPDNVEDLSIALEENGFTVRVFTIIDPEVDQRLMSEV